jgi:hypothetical protein
MNEPDQHAGSCGERGGAARASHQDLQPEMEAMVHPTEPHPETCPDITPAPTTRQLPSLREQAKRDQEERKQQFEWLRNQVPNYQLWCRYPLWTAEEAAALLLRLDPNLLAAQALQPFRDLSPLPEAFEQLKSLFERLHTAGIVNTPSSYVGWARKNSIECPAELKAELQRRNEIIDWETRCHQLEALLGQKEQEIAALTAKSAAQPDRTEGPEAPANLSAATRRLNTAYRVLGSVLAQRCGLDPAEPAIPVVDSSMRQRVDADLAAFGIGMDRKTLERCLRASLSAAWSGKPKAARK